MGGGWGGLLLSGKFGDKCHLQELIPLRDENTFDVMPFVGVLPLPPQPELFPYAKNFTPQYFPSPWSIYSIG